MNQLRIRTLRPADLPEMHIAFIEAFSDYKVTFSLDKEGFDRRFLEKLNLDFSVSVGAFFEQKLVGFIFHTVNIYYGHLTMYNGGTGVIPNFRSQGLVKQMYDYLLPKIPRDTKSCVLEVMSDNNYAIKAYKRIGFKKTRKLKCFKLLEEIEREGNQEVSITRNLRPNLDIYKRLMYADVSFLDTLYQLPFNAKNEVFLEANLKNELVGYIIFQPLLGRISQISVKREYWKKEIGTRLLFEAYSLSTVKQLTILNIDNSEKGLSKFLEKSGFVNEINQFEMELKFLHSFDGE